MEKKKLNRKKITKVYSLFGIFGLFKANVSQRPLSPGLPKSGQLSVLAAIDGWREGKSHLRDAYDEEGIALYEKFLTL